MAEKPPIGGIIPRVIWVERRIDDIVAAMNQFTETGRLPPEAWLTELREHYEWLEKNTYPGKKQQRHSEPITQ